MIRRSAPFAMLAAAMLAGCKDEGVTEPGTPNLTTVHLVEVATGTTIPLAFSAEMYAPAWKP